MISVETPATLANQTVFQRPAAESGCKDTLAPVIFATILENIFLKNLQLADSQYLK